MKKTIDYSGRDILGSVGFVFLLGLIVTLYVTISEAAKTHSLRVVPIIVIAGFLAGYGWIFFSMIRKKNVLIEEAIICISLLGLYIITFAGSKTVTALSDKCAVIVNYRGMS